jgi:hypothetical protein
VKAMDDPTWTLQGNYGGETGWEDLTSEATEDEIQAQLRDYQENDDYGGRFRIVRPYPGPCAGGFCIASYCDGVNHVDCTGYTWEEPA